MVAIKQAPSSTSIDLKGDDSARISQSAIRRGDNEQRVNSLRGEAEKKAAELLEKIKQRKKQAEEQLAPALFVPAMALNSTPVTAPLKLHFAPPSAAEHLPVGEVVAPTEHVVAERPKPAAEASAKPPTVVELVAEKAPPHGVVDKRSGVVVAEAFTQLKVMAQVNGESRLSALSSAAEDNSELVLEGSDTVFSAADMPLATSPDLSEMPRVMTRDALSTPSASERESASSLPLVDKKELTQGDERPLGLVAQQPTTLLATSTDSVELKAAPQALPEAQGIEGESMAGRRTLSYTFTQWKNSPVVTFELSGAGELAAMTTSVEVQQALQENQHLLASEKPLHFRDDEQDGERRGRQQSEQEDEA
ncbi:type III secretion system needle length determinant, SpaN/EivJ family [Yersinia bercovieri]|uniref:SpaN/EivJ family type III secretion system needle length determinant n=1 Tax=Yersinia bercovieri TaxID=634 RepID=UPI001643AF47|nr:type III secretion system needle length determinant, SpaN/EivJ family [Yersinia bercovieri]